MATPQGRFQYAGVDAEGAFSVLRTASISPDQLFAKFTLGPNLPKYGDIIVSYGGNSIQLKNCRAIRRTVSQSSAGKWADLTFHDRRWKWALPTIYGQYNYYRAGFKSKTQFAKKNARDLGKLLAAALGEEINDYSLIPEDDYPEVHFNGGLASHHFQELLDRYGLAITLNWGDQARLIRIGIGAEAPGDDRVMDYTKTYEPRIIPATLNIESSPLLVQADLPLTAVGYEYNTHEIKPIDQLSYMPAGGWPSTDPHKMTAVAAKYRDLAKSCVYKMFVVGFGTSGNACACFQTSMTLPKPRSVDIPAEVTFDMKGNVLTSDSGNTFWRILPIHDKQLRDFSSVTDKDMGTPAYIIGYFHDARHSSRNNLDTLPATFTVDEFKDYQGDVLRTAKPEAIMREGFNIDGERGLVHFSRPIYTIKRTGNKITSYAIPYILLRTSFNLRHPTNNDFVRVIQKFQTFNQDSVNNLVHSLRFEDLEYSIGPQQTETDIAQFTKSAQYYAAREQATYALGDALTVPAKGFLFDVNVDGAITSVHFERGQTGEATTVIEWHADNPRDKLTLKQKISNANDAKNALVLAQQAAQAKKNNSLKPPTKVF